MHLVFLVNLMLHFISLTTLVMKKNLVEGRNCIRADGFSKQGKTKYCLEPPHLILNGVGMNFCMKSCEAYLDCIAINYNVNRFICEMFFESEISNIAFVTEDVNYIFMEKTELAYCGVNNTCKDSSICVSTSSKQNICFNDDIPSPLNCSSGQQQTKYILNQASFVTWSSVYGSLSFYRLNSGASWSAAALNTNQWIKAVFGTPFVVTGMVTRGRHDLNNQYITSYTVKYSRPEDGTYVYVMENLCPYSNIVTFSAGVRGSLKEQYFPQAVTTTGIIISPVTWNSWISLRFDVIGCSV